LEEYVEEEKIIYGKEEELANKRRFEQKQGKNQ
jgi:hypothetical protein